MNSRIAIVALAIALLATPASATGHWGSSSWNSWGSRWDSWSGGSHSWSSRGHGWSKGDSHHWGDWCKDKKHHYGQGKKSNGSWGRGEKCYGDKKNSRNCKRKKNCDPPVKGVPTPTAGFAGLAIMGLILGRRRSKRG